MENEIYRLYLNALKETDNFQHIEKINFIDQPKKLKVVRLLLNLSQRDFANFLKINQSRVSLFELGKIKPTNKEAKEYLKILLKANIQPIDIEQFKSLEKKIKERGKFNGEYAKKMAQKSIGKASIISAQRKKPTQQENEIMDFLSKKGIKFERNPLIDLGVLKFVCDFAIPNAKKPEFLIEAKRLQTVYRKKQIICELGYKSIKIKQKFPQIKTIVIIDANLTNTERYILKQEFDYVFSINELKKLAVECGIVR